MSAKEKFMAEKTPIKEQIKKLTDQIEAGIKALFQSGNLEKYQAYLRTMSHFHHYSVNNQMLIFSQCPHATLVAGYQKWQNQFSRHVLRGEKGISILAPTPYKIKVEKEKLDPVTKLPLLDADGRVLETEQIYKESLEEDEEVTVYNFQVEEWHTYHVGEMEVLVHNAEYETSYGKSSGKYDTTADFLTNIESGSDSVKNWKGQEVKVPDGHIMSPRDPSFSAKPITEAGPYTLAQRDAFLAGNSAGTKLAPHHRHQIPVRDGGVIDELPGPGHPSGNQHTAGSPSRHPAKSIFNSERSGNVLRANEITQHWIDKGNRLIEVEPGVWIDPGF